MQLRRKRFDRPDEVRTVEKAHIDLVELGELAIGRAVFEPGWRWSEHVKPIVGTASCQVHHVGYVVSGHLHVEMTDGASLDVVGGDAFEIPPGHDAWVIGDEPWVSVDWAGRRLFAKSPQEISDRIFAAVVFTDLSGSTETLNRIGDARWRLLLAEHNEAVRTEIERFGGREAHTTGDGFLVLFDSPARAVRGAAAMIDASADHGLTARAGIHAERSSFRATKCEGSRSTQQRAFSACPSRAKSWSPPRSATSSRAQGSSSRTGGCSSCAAWTGGAGSQRWFARAAKERPRTQPQNLTPTRAHDPPGHA
jgi:hypothetical protein